jgi:glycosyltransferase involved in cell wall biosynthesis
MKGPITISIIAPVYRVERYIGRFTESVCGQSYPHIELIVVNDQTDDSSIDMLNELVQTRYPGFKDKVRIVDQPHAGLPAARRTGLKYATGDYVWHVDPDDWLEADAAQKIAECASRTDADVIYFDFFKEFGRRTEVKLEKDYDSSMKREYQMSMYAHKSSGAVWNKCVKRRIYVENTIYSPDYSHAEDAFMVFQLVGYAGSLCHLNESLYHYRKDNPVALTRQSKNRRCRDMIFNYMNLYELYRNSPFNPVDFIMDDVFYRAGRYSLRYGLGLFDEFPYLADKISEAGIRSDIYTSIPMQLILKVYASLRRR